MNNRLRVLRAEKNWTQADLADIVGVSRQAIIAVENGKYDPALALAFKLSRAFGKTVEDVFVWHYEDMPGLNPKVGMHRLNIKAGAKPVKQPQRGFRPDIMDAIEQEVRKLIGSRFIREE